MNQRGRRTDNVAFYEAFAAWYPRVYADLQYSEAARQWAMLLAREAWPPDANRPPRLLDLGCGPGLCLPAWSALGYAVAGQDSSPAMLRLARQHLRGHNLNGIRLWCADIRAARPRTGPRFDVIAAQFNFLNLFAPGELRGVLNGIAARLRPGGILITDITALPPSHATPGTVVLEDGETLKLESKKVGTQTWTGKNLDLTEKMWCHSRVSLERACSHKDWSAWSWHGWRPHLRRNPWQSPVGARQVLIARRSIL